MENLDLKIEQLELKNKLLRLVEFIGSEDYYKISGNRRKIIQNRKICMELYLSTLSMELYEDVDSIIVPDMAFLGMMGSLFGGPFKGSSSLIPATQQYVKETDEKV